MVFQKNLGGASRTPIKIPAAQTKMASLLYSLREFVSLFGTDKRLIQK
jgi:hypothetical protein